MTIKEKVMGLFGVSPDKSESVLGGNCIRKTVEITDEKTFDKVEACVFADDLQESFSKTLRLMSELADDETLKSSMCNGAIAVAERKVLPLMRIEKIGVIVCQTGYLRCSVIVTHEGVSFGTDRKYIRNGKPSFTLWGKEGFSPESVSHAVLDCIDEAESVTRKLPMTSITRYPVDKMVNRIVELFKDKED